ncbi:DUF2304 domain-containing protein [Candidatus Saccharibacteria bacterium]|nr:DUF2304 domain-containing protein [Candidatus Saccharibacteria bacterium]
MSSSLSIILTIFSLCWIATLIIAIWAKKISIRYSMIWFFAAIILLFVGVFPSIIDFINIIFNFAVTSNLVIGILLSLLMVITFALTLFSTKQKKQIDLLIQEVSLLKSKIKKDDKQKK